MFAFCHNTGTYTRYLMQVQKFPVFPVQPCWCDVPLFCNSCCKQISPLRITLSETLPSSLFHWITHYWCEHWEEHLWPGPGPPLSPYSSAPSESFLDRTPQTQTRPRCSGMHAEGLMVWKWAWTWSWLLCQRRQSLLHIYPMGKGRLQEGTHSPRESHLVGRRCGPGRWQR